MLNRRILNVFLAIIMLLSLCACTPKEPITNDIFVDYFSGSDEYTVESIPVENLEDFVSATVVSLDKYKIYFYVLNDNDAGRQAYLVKEKEIEDQKTTNNIMVNLGTFSKFSGSNSNEFFVASRIGNTLIYSRAPIINKEEIQLILEKLGY